MVPEKDAVLLAVNGLPINRDVYITGVGFRDTVGKELEVRRIKAEYLDFSVIRASQCALSCNIQPLRIDY